MTIVTKDELANLLRREIFRNFNRMSSSVYGFIVDRVEDIAYFLLQTIPKDRLEEIPNKIGSLMFAVINVASLQRESKKLSYGLFEKQFIELYFSPNK